MRSRLGDIGMKIEGLYEGNKTPAELAELVCIERLPRRNSPAQS